MTCTIDGCTKKIQYVKRQICQMHYFRFMRTGMYDLEQRVSKYRISNAAGYQSIHEPDHWLSDNRGYVYEHRFVLFNAKGHDIDSCEMCGKEWSWHNGWSSHVDHIDEDNTNNHIDNLRPLCNACNTHRTEKDYINHPNSVVLFYYGEEKTAAEWGRDSRIPVKAHTILSRLKAGWDPVIALTKPSQKTKG